MPEATDGRDRGIFKIGAGLVAAVVMLAAVVVFTRVGQRTQDGTARPADDPVTIEQAGNIYAGIPARIQFVSAAAEAAARDMKGAPAPGSAQDPASVPDRDKLAAAWDILTRTGTVFNAFSTESELGRLNANPDMAPVAVSDWMAEVAGFATTISQMTQGAFDATVMPLKSLWKKASETGIPPTEGDIADALGRMGWGYVNLLRTPDNKWQMARVRPGMQLDFGGIVKGWSVGQASNWLADRGVRSALVQVGGEIALSGNSPSGKPWRIGIRHPLEKDRNWTVLTISGRVAVSTSGNYEQPIKIGGTDYYHIFDPTTGRPIPSNILGTTVVVSGGKNPNAIADGLATAFSVMGPERALELAADLPDVDVLFIVRDPVTGQPVEIATPGFNRYRPSAR